MELTDIERLSESLHHGQTDKGGQPYATHPKRVAAMVQRSGGTWAQIAAGYLHDAIEDTDATAESLAEMGVPDDVIEIVAALTRPDESDVDYYEQVKRCTDAVLVKLADISENLDPSRLSKLDPKTQARLRRKYAFALLALADEL